MKRVVIIGAGNVATHLGRALQNKNFVVSQIFSRTENSATQLASDLGVPFTTNLQSLDREADIYFYCVNDAVLCDVINKIDIPDALHVHTAGSLPLSIFESHLQYRRYGVF
ncbi:MAG: NAD(P)-binding domain-containing protein, partial [Paludibacteraceae bacterium]|nr:NAD(P)-binding domain-containing protein [Paludibacteraceae bacterium]